LNEVWTAESFESWTFQFGHDVLENLFEASFSLFEFIRPDLKFVPTEKQAVMNVQYRQHEVKLARYIAESQAALARLKEELLSLKEWMLYIQTQGNITRTNKLQPKLASQVQAFIHFSDLPPEMLEEIFSHLDFITRNRLRR
jgi:hypothetical protein